MCSSDLGSGPVARLPPDHTDAKMHRETATRKRTTAVIATGPLPESEQGCCKTGCCSFNAVGPWATGELLHGIIVLVCACFLYERMELLTSNLVGLVTVFNTLMSSTYPALVEYTRQLDQDVVRVLRENAEQFAQLPSAVIAPGVLAAFFLMLAGMCPLVPANKGSYIGTTGADGCRRCEAGKTSSPFRTECYDSTKPAPTPAPDSVCVRGQFTPKGLKKCNACPAGKYGTIGGPQCDNADRKSVV